VLARGGVDGHEVAPCRRSLIGACQERGPHACPLPTREELGATLAAVQAAEATVHPSPLCAATLPATPAASIDDAIAAGRDAAAALAATNDPGFQIRGPTYPGRVFQKLFIQGTLGHGAAFVPLGDVVRAMARPTRAVTYAGNGPAVYGIVGIAGGNALGVLLTSCPAD
jgi:hypothetical protein